MTAPAPRAAAPGEGSKPTSAAQRQGTRGAPTSSARRAAARALDTDTMRVELPGPIGAVRLPSPQRLAFYGGIAALGVLGIVDWPVALVIGVGHLLADDHHHKLLATFGEALAEA